MWRNGKQRHSIFTLWASALNHFFLQVHVTLVLKTILKDKNEIKLLANIFVTIEDHETKIKIW